MKFRSTSTNSASTACQGDDEVDGVTVKWLQYAGLQHLASPVASLDQRQLLHDLLLQRYGGQAIPRSENYEYSAAQCETLNSSGKSSNNGSKWVGIGLLDLKSTHDDTNFLSEDLTTEPLDLLPSSPPKVVNRDVSFTVSGKSQVKSNKTIRATIDQKKSEKNAKGKEVHKSKEKATDIALALEKEIGIYNKDEDMIVSEDMDVVALQFGSPVWSPTRGLYSEISLIKGAECKRSTGKHDDDFAFIRDEETSRNPENNANNQRLLGKLENISKKSTLSMDNINLDNATPESATTGLDFKFNSLLEDMKKLHSFRTDRTSKENNADKTTDKEIKSEPHDSTYISSPRKSESRIKASSVHLKETNSNNIRVAGEENKSIRTRTPAKKESVLTSKSQVCNSKRASTQRTEINTKDNKITNIEPDKRANGQIHNSISIPREEAKEKNAAKFRVVVRKRPLNKKEMLKKEKDILSVEDDERLVINAPKVKVDLTAYIEKHEFSFDAVLHDHVTDDEVYNVTVGPSISTILEQAKLTCFAFGYTGSGKTFTMGNLSLRASKDVLRMLQKSPHANRNLTLWVSYFEIHGKTIFDLLNQRRKLCIREDGDQQVRIVGLQEYKTSDIEAVEKVISKGNAERSKSSTGVNEESSRSHSILQLVIKQNPMFPANGTRRKSTESGELKAKAKGGKVIGRISFIDLAGSERGADYTHNDHDKRKGVEINKSLLALKECIRALDNEQNHIPFRGSKLTEVLRDSFIGDSSTVMICCVSPSASSCEQTLNSLRYAERVKNLCKDGYSQKDQGASEILTDSNKLDQRVEKITRIEGDKNRKLYNPTPEIADNLSMRDIYNCTPTIGESYRFMSGCGLTGSKELETHVEYKIQNDISNSYSTSYVSNLDFGTQKLPQIYGTDQAGLNIEKDIQAILEKSNHSFTFSQGKEYSNDKEIAEKIPSFYESSDNHEPQKFSMKHAGPSNSLDVHQEEQVDIEPMIEEIYENELDLISSGLPLQSIEETSWNHQNQEGVPSETGDIKTIFEVENSCISNIDKEKECNSFAVNKEMLGTTSVSENNINRGPGGRPSLYEGEKDDIHELDFRYSSLSIEEIFENQMEEEAVKEIGEHKNVVDVSLMARAKSTERELPLPLHIESKDLQVILSNNPTKPRSDVSTQNSLKNSENKKAPNKSPNRRIPSQERNNKNSKSLSKEELELPLKNHEEQYISGAKASEGMTKENKAINLFEEEEALLAAHRKVIQNTMNILCEEINLLEQVDQQGTVPSRYLAKLSSVLSRKAADLASLQEHIIRFQQCLQD